MEQEVTIQVKVTVMDMYSFLMHHSYSGIQGILNLLISGGAIVLLLCGVGRNNSLAMLALILAAALFTVINPINLLLKSIKQVVLLPTFRKPLSYTFGKEGILVRQEEAEMLTGWNEVVRVVENRRSILVYMSAVRAYILPKKQYVGQVEAVKKQLEKYAQNGGNREV